jgi:hypothetical protein
MPQPIEFVENLQWWFNKEFGTKFKDRGRTLPSGRQQDGYSCGLYAINMIAHGALGEPILEHQHRRKERLRWFQTLSQYHFEDVSVFYSPP